MSHFPRLLLAVLGCIVLLVGLSMVPSRTATAKEATPVIVENTPLPVTGIVNVGNFPSSQIVNFNGTAQPVSISNTASSPLPIRDVDNPAAHALQVELCIEVGATFCSAQSFSSSYTVPEGERFAVQYVSGGCVASTGTVMSNEINTFVNGQFGTYEILLHPEQTRPDLSVSSQQVRFYADPTSNVSMNMGFSTDYTGFCHLELSGYTVPYTVP